MQQAAPPRLEDLARAGGFERIGVCDVEPFIDTLVQMRERVQEGHIGRLHFTYTDPDRATDIRRSFPWAVRIVVAAWTYLPGAGGPADRDGTGRVARFAIDDAYVPLRRGLREVAAELEKCGFRAEVVVDDNRMVDRAAAVRAGLGWWGKSTMVIAPGVGPWFLIGSVVTDAPIPVTEPMRRECGTCVACIPACPTGALIRPGVLDANLCLAAIAQAPGVIPRRLRVAMGDRLYGCDDCLEACPPGRQMFASSAPRGGIDLLGLLASSDRTILAEYEHFYIPRRRARFLRRNALVVLGNIGDERHIGVLAGYLGHRDWLLRVHAAWALGQIGGRAAGAALLAAADVETNDEVRDEIIRALDRSGHQVR